MSRLAWKPTPPGRRRSARSSRRRCRRRASPSRHLAAGSDASERQPRLLVAVEQPCREAVAPLDLAEERLAVLGVADGARRDRERALGAERLGLAAVLGEQLRTRAIGTGRSRRRASTPSPSRVIAQPARRPRSTRPASTSATSSRVEFVPRSTAATRVTSSGRTPRTPPTSARAPRAPRLTARAPVRASTEQALAWRCSVGAPLLEPSPPLLGGPRRCVELARPRREARQPAQVLQTASAW